MISLRGITKNYGTLTVLKGIDLTIPEGRIMVILGPSGAGKTTLLQIAGTLGLPDAGTVDYDGLRVSEMKDKDLSHFRNREIGFVFQMHQLLPEFTAQENVALPSMIGGVSKGESMGKAAELLTKLGLGDRLNHKPGALSGGERQRVAFARALVNDPKVVFADEPTGSLDSQNRDEIISLVKRLNEELSQTFVIVTHDAAVAEMADVIVEMADGRIIDIREGL